MSHPDISLQPSRTYTTCHPLASNTTHQHVFRFRTVTSVEACDSSRQSWPGFRLQVHCGTLYTTNGVLSKKTCPADIYAWQQPQCICVIINTCTLTEPFHISLSLSVMPAGGVLFLAPWSLIKNMTLLLTFTPAAALPGPREHNHLINKGLPPELLTRHNQFSTNWARGSVRARHFSAF